MPLPPQLLMASGFILATLAGGFAIYYWRRSSGLYALLVEGANRFEELRKRGQQFEAAAGKSEERAKQIAESATRFEHAALEARNKTAELLKRLEAKENEIRLVTEKLELQKGHLEKQLTKATDRLQTLENSAFEAEQRHMTELNDLKQRTGNKERELNDRLKTLGAKTRELETKLEASTSERSKLEKRAQEGDPEEMRRLKRRLAQYDRLYSSMRGLREMADERNRNWEVALRKLSGWIIQQRSNGRMTPPESIGPLVGQALQAIGAQLINDGENSPDSDVFNAAMDAPEATRATSDISHTITLSQVDEVAKIMRT